MTVLVDSILLRVGIELQDEGSVRWTTTERLGYLNDGQREIAKLKPDAKLRTVTHALVTGARQALPADCISIADIRQNESGAVALPCDRAVLDAFSPGWMVKPTASTIRHWMPDTNPGVFYVYPAQGATPGSILLTYSALPAAVGLGNNIDLRDVYAENLTHYILFRAYSKDAEFGGSAERALFHAQAYQQ